MDNITPAGYRKQKFTVLSGERTYGYTGFEKTEASPALFDFWVKLGLKEFMQMVCDVISYTFKTLFTI